MTVKIDLALLNTPKYRNLTGAEIYVLISTLGVNVPTTVVSDPTPPAPPAAPAQPVAQPVDEDEDEDEPSLLDRANAIFEAGHHELLTKKDGDTSYVDAFVDMRKKLKKYGSFKTDKQEGYFTKLCTWAEERAAKKAKKAAKQAASKPEPVAAGSAKPGDEDFVSASGISGAHY